MTLPYGLIPEVGPARDGASAMAARPGRDPLRAQFGHHGIQPRELPRSYVSVKVVCHLPSSYTYCLAGVNSHSDKSAFCTAQPVCLQSADLFSEMN